MSTAPIFTGLSPADRAANPFFAGDGVIRSLNRARVVALPGAAGADDLLGHSAHELLSAAAVAELIRAAAGPLRLDPAAAGPWRALNARFDDPATRPAALAVAGAVGRRLGALLLMLWRGDPANRAARPDWGDAHWAYWREVRRVVAGGGLLAGRLGEAAVPAASAFLAKAGCPIIVERSPFGDAIALAGLARHTSADTGPMLLFDFGQTSLKRGLATYGGGLLREIVVLPPLPAPAGDDDTSLAASRARWAAMREVIATDFARFGKRGAAEEKRDAELHGEERRDTEGERAIGLSLATHLDDGHPFATDRGRYGRLGDLAPHLATFLRDDLVATLGPLRAFALLHDGLAAGSAYAGQPQTVVLTLGTAIGAGYVPEGVGVRVFDPAFRLRYAS